MSGEHFLLFIGIPFTVAALGLLSWRIATSKGRSGWWALAGLGFHIGLIVVLALSVIRRPRPGKAREPDEPDADAATPSEGPSDEEEPRFRPARQWNSQLMRGRRVGWRSNDLLFLLEFVITCIMSMWLVVGSLGAVVVVVQIILGVGAVHMDGVPTDSVLGKLVAGVICGVFGVCGALYLFHIRPDMIARSERDLRRRPRR